MLEIEWLGFIFSAGKMKPGDRKTDAIAKLSVPKNVHVVQKFIGLVSFFRRFIPRFALKAAPLTKLRKEDEFVWGTEQKLSFETLKQELTSEPILQLYNPTALTELHTDASALGLAGMLLQRDDVGVWHLVYCVSRKTSQTEKNYHSSKLELMAIVWSVERLRQFLLPIKFTVVSDCQALIYMNTYKTSNPQIARRFSLLSEYEYSIRHKPGKDMSHVDALSREPTEECNGEILDAILDEKSVVFEVMSLEDKVLMYQHSDEELKHLIHLLKQDLVELTQEERNLIECFTLRNGRLFRRVIVNNEECLLYVVPKSMRKSLVVSHHDLQGHFSVDRVKASIQKNFWFPKMKRYIKQHIAQCIKCLMFKTKAGKQNGELHPTSEMLASTNLVLIN
jgi:hypothetical protein